MSLTIADARKIAQLARLAPSDAELATFTPQLSAILDYVDQLRQLPTDGVEELAHPLPLRNVFRDDTLQPSLPVDEALANAPARTGDFYSVPAVLDAGSDESHA